MFLIDVRPRCDEIVLGNDGMVKFILDFLTDYFLALESVSDCYKTEKCIIKLVILVPLQYNLFLINTRLKKCVGTCHYIFYSVHGWNKTHKKVQ